MESVQTPTALSRNDLRNHYDAVRRASEQLCQPLAVEDFVVQPIEDVSPPKWHLGHTTWFYEQVILEKFAAPYRPYHERYHFLFNSYYEAFGTRVERDARGTLSRPTVEEVLAYRRAVDDRVREAIDTVDDDAFGEFAGLLILGLNHEQQHQELLVTDIKYIFASNPLSPVYTEVRAIRSHEAIEPTSFIPFEGGLVEIGAEDEEFTYDNENPRHAVFLRPFALASRPITCGEFLGFISDDGYNRPDLWLSKGWDALQEQKWRSPLFWVNEDDTWRIITMSGLKEMDHNEPVCHVSHYEAAAFARWAGKRLPTEFEWELAARQQQSSPITGNFVESGFFHPVPLGALSQPGPLRQMLGDVWEWTSSAYLPYPGYRQVAGPLGEYNGKFMNDQMVLRGGSCATPRDHIRYTYRNFFQSDRRWQVTGLRLADDA